MFEGQYQIFIRDDTHPIFKDVADPKVKEAVQVPVDRAVLAGGARFQWNADPGKVHELVTLPNRKDMARLQGSRGHRGLQGHARWAAEGREVREDPAPPWTAQS